MPDSLIDQALALEGITGKAADFAKSIYHQESSSGGNTTTSNRGAVGGMQIIPSTFKSVADKGWDITNPLQNVRAGIRYANKMFNAANEDPVIAAAGYYGGTGGLLKAKKGIAVSDPKNPNAPTTLEYGSQVAGRMNPQPSAYLNDFMSRLKSTVAENKQKKIDEENAKVASGDDINSFMQTIKLASQPDQPQAQPDTLIGDLKQGVSKLGSAIWNNGNPITGALKTAYGIGEAGVGGLAGMGGKAVEGLYGTASGLTGMLPESLGGGGGFEQGYNQGAQQIQSLTQHIPQPVTNAGQAVAQIMGAPSAEFARGGQGAGQIVENLTGSKTAGGLAASGLETLGNAVAMGLPLKGRIAPEVVAGEQARQFAANRPAQEVPQVTQPIQAAERPAQQAASGLPATFEEIKAKYDAEQAAKAQQAAQAETMQRPTETPIAATADQTATVAPTVAESAPKSQGVAYTASNKPIEFKYEVVPADKLVTSHDNALNVNSAFPAELQPRDRTRAASDTQISAIQNKLNPARLTESPSVTDGAPVVGLDNVVESGNARTIAIRRGYGSGQSLPYKQYLANNADRFGLDKTAIEGMDNPVLIRRRTNEVDRAEFAKDANVSNTAAMSPSERAVGDASRLPDTETLRIGEDGSVNLAANPDFVRGFIKSMPEAERGEMMNAVGELSQAGQSRIAAALTQKAYGDATVLERINENIGETGKRISAALVQKAPALVAMADDVRQGALHENTVASDLAQASNKYADIKAAGGTIEDYLKQGQLVPDGMTSGAREALQVFGDNARSGKAVADYIQSKIDEVKQQGNPSQNTLFQADKAKIAAEVNQVRDDIAAQVLATGKHDAKYAKAAGDLVAAYYEATAKAIGKSVKETFDAVPLKVSATKADIARSKVEEARARKNGDTANAKIILGDIGHEMVLGEKANASSFIHEVGHHFLETSSKLAKDSPALKADIDAVMAWAGHEGRSFDSLPSAQKTAVHEKFAETFENYMLTGKAPTKAMAKVFERFKSWMTDVYTSLKEFGKQNPDAELNGSITDVMDSWLGGERKQIERNRQLESKRTGGSVPTELTDLKRSAPKDGGVSPSLWAARYNVMRNLGLQVGEILGGWVEGDSRRIGQATELAKYDTPTGQKTKQIIERARDSLREYADQIIKETGGTIGAEAHKRGATIVDALQSYKDWYKAKTQEYYKAADKIAKNTSGIEMDGLNSMLREGSKWQGIKARWQLRKGLMAYMNEQGVLAKDGFVKPMSAKKAEGIHQYLNGQRTFETQGLIGEINAAIDDSVINTLGGSTYKEARAVYRQYNQVFNDPKGIAKILEHDESNRAIAYDVVGKKITALAETNLDQFRHIKDQLQGLPTKDLQVKADAAIGEIRAQIAERITKSDTPAATYTAFESYRGSKLKEIFGEKLADKLENYVAGVGILRGVDKQASGTASQIRNNIDKYGGIISNVVGTATGGVFGGATGALMGSVTSHLSAAKIKDIAFERIDQKSLKEALTFKQKEMMQKVYEAKAKGLADSPELKAARRDLDNLGDPSKSQIQSISRRVESSQAWQKFSTILTDQQKAAVKNLGVIAWLSQTGQDKEAK